MVGQSLDVKATERYVVDQLKGNVFINEYIVIKNLGKGAYGTVKLVYHTEDDMLYAMKVMRSRMQHTRTEGKPSFHSSILPSMQAVSQASWSCATRSPRYRKDELVASSHQSMIQFTRNVLGSHSEFFNEIEVMKELDHENVVKLYEVIASKEQNKLLMVMEYVEGGSVLEGSDSFHHTPLPEDTAAKYFRDIVKGLEYLHFNRVVHGDLKPDNFLLTMSAKVKISDFGSARLCEEDDIMVLSQGTPAFMSPEACAGKPFNGFLADVWSLGVCLYMFIYGHPPFGTCKSTTYQMYEAVQRGDLKLPPTTNSGATPVSPSVRHLLFRMLEKDAQKRASLEDVMQHDWVSTKGGKLNLSIHRLGMRVFELMKQAGARGSSKRAVKLDEVNAQELHNLIPDGETRIYTKGDMLLRPNQAAEGLFFIIKGDVEVWRPCMRGRYVDDDDFADDFSEEESDSDSDQEKMESKHIEGLKVIAQLRDNMFSSMKLLALEGAEAVDRSPGGARVGSGILETQEASILSRSSILHIGDSIDDDAEYEALKREQSGPRFSSNPQLHLQASTSYRRSPTTPPKWRRSLQGQEIPETHPEIEAETLLSALDGSALLESGESNKLMKGICCLEKKAVQGKTSNWLGAGAGPVCQQPKIATSSQSGSGGTLGGCSEVHPITTRSSRLSIASSQSMALQVSQKGMVPRSHLSRAQVDPSDMAGGISSLRNVPHSTGSLGLDLDEPSVKNETAPTSPMAMSSHSCHKNGANIHPGSSSNKVGSFHKYGGSGCVPKVIMEAPQEPTTGSPGESSQSTTPEGQGQSASMSNSLHQSQPLEQVGPFKKPTLWVPGAPSASRNLTDEDPLHTSGLSRSNESTGHDSIDASVTTPIRAMIHSQLQDSKHNLSPELASTISKMKRAVGRTDSMHRRMANMVIMAKQHARKEMRKGKMMIVSTRGPGGAVGDILHNDDRPKQSRMYVIACSEEVEVLLLRHDRIQDHADQPLVRAAINRSLNALLVQEAMERFIECENEVVRADNVRQASIIPQFGQTRPSMCGVLSSYHSVPLLPRFPMGLSPQGQGSVPNMDFIDTSSEHLQDTIVTANASNDSTT